YYRLNVIQLIMPPLRERGQDILLLARYFAAKSGRRTKRKHLEISAEAQSCLIHYSWPGNVRELENAIERATVLGTVDVILPEDLPEAILESQATGHQATNYHEAVKDAKRQLILKAVEQTNGNYTEAARQLGIHPNNLHRIIRDLNLKPLLKT
ncbi:MAG TPA: helix-turn-helix domain-containing protein, partial [Acidobacteriota bacterium]|nr:helix-turn-helix domain-containing protein [Acidobacteriota bacterium]